MLTYQLCKHRTASVQKVSHLQAAQTLALENQPRLLSPGYGT